jgi:hypothetical protein
MIKKVIIYSLTFALLSTIIAPDFVNAMGTSSSVSDDAGWALLAITVVVGIVIYYNYSKKKSDAEENVKKTEVIKEITNKRIAKSGGLAVFRW